MTRRLSLVGIVILLLFAPGSSWTYDVDATPPVLTSDGISYMTGGVGMDEREALFAASHDYGLKLVFAMREETAFLTEITVRIAADDGEPMMEVREMGPYLFVKLPPGKYDVTATSRDKALVKSASVRAGKQADAAFYW